MAPAAVRSPANTTTLPSALIAGAGPSWSKPLPCARDAEGGNLLPTDGVPCKRVGRRVVAPDPGDDGRAIGNDGPQPCGAGSVATLIPLAAIEVWYWSSRWGLTNCHRAPRKPHRCCCRSRRRSRARQRYRPGLGGAPRHIVLETIRRAGVPRPEEVLGVVGLRNAVHRDNLVVVVDLHGVAKGPIGVAAERGIDVPKPLRCTVAGEDSLGTASLDVAGDVATNATVPASLIDGPLPIPKSPSWPVAATRSKS